MLFCYDSYVNRIEFRDGNIPSSSFIICIVVIVACLFAFDYPEILCFYIKLKMVLSLSVKYRVRTLMEIVLNL